MADRKVLVKYYPPDFDPEKLREKSRLYRNQTQKKKKGVKQMNVRFMFPFTMCCATCGEFIYIGTKFNSRVEKVQGEDYLGLPIWRFYGRCPHCRAEVAFRTDPKHTEYVLEFGGTRTYDPRKDAELAANTLKDQLEEEIKVDSMRALEHKTYNTANELMALEQLDELRKINKRLLNRESTVDDALEWLKQGGLNKEHDGIQRQEVLDSEDLADFEKAKEEISQRQLNATLGQGSSDEGEEQPTSSSNGPKHDVEETNRLSSSPSSSTLLNSKSLLFIKKRASNPSANHSIKQQKTGENQFITTTLLEDYNSDNDAEVKSIGMKKMSSKNKQL